jgi:septal ring factor EnvC (AmiA/AmiB activator)
MMLDALKKQSHGSVLSDSEGLHLLKENNYRLDVILRDLHNDSDSANLTTVTQEKVSPDSKMINYLTHKETQRQKQDELEERVKTFQRLVREKDEQNEALHQQLTSVTKTKIEAEDNVWKGKAQLTLVSQEIALFKQRLKEESKQLEEALGELTTLKNQQQANPLGQILKQKDDQVARMRRLIMELQGMELRLMTGLQSLLIDISKFKYACNDIKVGFSNSLMNVTYAPLSSL